MSIKTIIVSGIVVCCVAQTLSMVIPGGMGGQMPGGFGECATVTGSHTSAVNSPLKSLGYTLDRITCVREQIVNGIIYDIDLIADAGPSCKKTCRVDYYSGEFGNDQSSPTETISCGDTCETL